MGRFSHLLTDVVTVSAKSGVTGYGEPTYAAQSAVAARVEYDYKVVVGPDGASVVTTHIVGSEEEIALESRVWLPGASVGDNTAAKIIMSIKSGSTPDASGTLYEARV